MRLEHDVVAAGQRLHRSMADVALDDPGFVQGALVDLELTPPPSPPRRTTGETREMPLVRLDMAEVKEIAHTPGP